MKHPQWKHGVPFPALSQCSEVWAVLVCIVMHCVTGYDVSTKKSYNDTIRKFDKTVGLKYLKGMHINDSKCAPHLLCGHQAPLRSLRLCQTALNMQQAVSTLCQLALSAVTRGGATGRAGAPLAAGRTGTRTLGAA